jgi:hypothetical protein
MTYCRITVREAGLFVFAEVFDLGLVLQWDRGTRVYVRADPKWKDRVSDLMTDNIQYVSSRLFGFQIFSYAFWVMCINECIMVRLCLFLPVCMFHIQNYSVDLDKIYYLVLRDQHQKLSGELNLFQN